MSTPGRVLAEVLRGLGLRIPAGGPLDRRRVRLRWCPLHRGLPGTRGLRVEVDLENDELVCECCGHVSAAVVLELTGAAPESDAALRQAAGLLGGVIARGVQPRPAPGACSPGAQAVYRRWSQREVERRWRAAQEAAIVEGDDPARREADRQLDAIAVLRSRGEWA